MMDLNCLNTIITDNLAVHIDLSSTKSWNLNSGFTTISISKWVGAVSDNISLPDFGLTAFDNGRVNDMDAGLTITPDDTKVELYPIGYNNATGGTFYTLSGITAVTGTSVGNHFNVNGGYLQGFFKLKDYNFELLPARYGRGITIETLINIYNASFNDGYFYLMGARAEDKYVPAFSGESTAYTMTVNEDGREFTSLVFSGYTTSEGHYLNNYVEEEKLRPAINDENYFDTFFVESFDKGINQNVIGFFISSDKRIGYSRINSKGLVESQYSENILATGWTLITIVFKPYEIITDPDILKCAELRKGDFIVYVNGRRFWKIEEFDEYYFKGFKTQREKQLGVPYNISWGGGSFGLKHSYHHDLPSGTLVQDPVKDNQLIESIYSNSFVGAIQKLRIYDTAFNSQMVLHNASIEAKKTAYNLIINKGGRIING